MHLLSFLFEGGNLKPLFFFSYAFGLSFLFGAYLKKAPHTSAHKSWLLALPSARHLELSQHPSGSSRMVPFDTENFAGRRGSFLALQKPIC